MHQNPYYPSIKDWVLISAERCNEWICVPNLDIYMRKGFIGVNGEILAPAVTIASIQARNPGSGSFTEQLELLEDMPYHIYVECVHNYRLQAFLGRRGYESVNDYCGQQLCWLKRSFSGDNHETIRDGI